MFLSEKQFAWLADLFLIGWESILMVFFAPISIKLPFTPILLFFALYLYSAERMILGNKRESLEVLSYLLQGVMCLSVFAMRNSGLLHLKDSRNDYLIGHIVAAPPGKLDMKIPWQ
jgi:biotin transporter BioY